MDPTLTPGLNPVFSITFLIGLVVLVVVEIIGVRRKGKGDTLTEHWRWIESWLPDGWAWVFRIFTGGLLVWTLLHFLVGAD